jgi:NADPH:quinone reductase-like Zn-dependent oxidoreductase
LTKGGKYISTLPNNALMLYQAFNFLRNRKAYFIMAKTSGLDLSVIAGFMKKQQLKSYVQETFPLGEGADAHQIIEKERVRGKLVLQIIE